MALDDVFSIEKYIPIPELAKQYLFVDVKFLSIIYRNVFRITILCVENNFITVIAERRVVFTYRNLNFNTIIIISFVYKIVRSKHV